MRITAILCFVICAACIDGTGPAALRPIEVQLCSASIFAPNWFVFHNEGHGWGTATPASKLGEPSWRYTVLAGPRVAIAFGFAQADPSGGPSNIADISVLHLTAEELESVQCPHEDPGPRGAGGEVFNYQQVAEIRMGPAARGGVAAGSPRSVYGMGGVPEGLADLLAWDARPLFIIRHDIDVPTLPPGTKHDLDFASDEARPIDSTTVTVEGASGNTGGSLEFQTRNGSRRFLGAFMISGTSGNRLPSIPSSITAPGDYHRLSVTYPGRTVVQFYRSGPTTVSLGPMLSAHMQSQVATTPTLRWQARLPFQPSYPTFARAFFRQDTNITTPCTRPPVCVYTDSRRVSVGVTAAYLGGTPATWDLIMPDFTKAPGFNSAQWGFKVGRPVSVCVEALDADFGLFFSRVGTRTEGLTMKRAYSGGCPSSFLPLSGLPAPGPY